MRENDIISNFKVLRITEIPELNTTAVELRHRGSGARLIHLKNDDKNNLFSIAFRTPVFDNTGVPHIIEHSVLAGSEKFPLKDPFKEMLKGSLQTFLNAITFPDKTVYPVSSQVEEDFFNLVDVYCDAVFNPLLRKNTFYQEGWHFELEEGQKEVSIKGIVYNEMKGVFSDFRSHVERKIISALYPDTTYNYESGGEPEHITDLTYDEFKNFHKRFYHPSNSYIVLYGNIDTETTLNFLDSNYLSKYETSNPDSKIVPQKKWKKPEKIEFEAPSSKEDDGFATVLLTWITADSKSSEDVQLNNILSRYFFSSQSSPLKRALIDSKLGEDLDDMCGFDSDLVQGFFAAGLKKVKPENAEKVREIIIDTLRKEYENGLDEDLLEGTIRRVEFSLREITSGDSFPYNLSLANKIYRSWLYGGDPLTHIAFENSLNKIKELKRTDPDFFRNKIKELFLDNPHSLFAIVKASAELGEELGEKSSLQAKKLTENFTDEKRTEILKLTKDLISEQSSETPKEIVDKLPKLSLDSIPRDIEKIPCVKKTIDDATYYLHPIFTSGIVYIDISFNLDFLPDELVYYYPLYSEVITRCGAAGLSSEEMSKRISLVTGGISCSDFATTNMTNNQTIFRGFIHAKSLENRFDETLDLLKYILLEPELSDENLIEEIVFEMKNDLQTSVIRSGHSFAYRKAASFLVETKLIEEKCDGIEQLRFLNNIIIDKSFSSIVDKIKKIHSLVINKKGCTVSVTADKCDIDGEGSLYTRCKSFVDSLPSFTPMVPVGRTLPEQNEDMAVFINSSVNYVAKTIALDEYEINERALAYLLSRNLSTGFLWDKIRVEGGAYGGMAASSFTEPVFSCMSYRDPNILSTLDNFTKAFDSIKGGISAADIEQSIVGTIGKLDHPKSPHEKGLFATMSELIGRSAEIQSEIRNSILDANAKQLAEFAERLSASGKTVAVVLGSKTAVEKEIPNFKSEELL